MTIAAIPQTQGATVDAVETRGYAILGVRVNVTADVAAVLGRVEDTYAAFRCDPWADEAGLLELALSAGGDGKGFTVSGGEVPPAWFADGDEAIIDLLGRLVGGLMPRLQQRGIVAIHAGAVVHRGRAIVICGQSGQGKTTLVLGLLARELGLLSDEFAIVGHSPGAIAPYRRGVHIRPGTPELIGQLGFLNTVPRHELGGGIEWALTPRQLESVFPGCLVPAAPLGHVLLLDGAPRAGAAPVITPIPAALAAMELLRGTWSASVDFAGSLSAVGSLLGGAHCARLRSGDLDATVDRILQWVDEGDA